jgi:hypothetical protein
LRSGDSLEREGRTCPASQEIFQTLKTARHIAVDERDADTGVDWDPRLAATGMMRFRRGRFQIDLITA